jgi:outer membrane protein
MVLLIFASFLSVESLAQSHEPAEPTKIGVVDLQRAVEGSPDFLKAGEAWTVEMNRLSAEITTKREQLQSMQEQLRTQQSTLNETARLQLVQRIEKLETELDQMVEDGQIALNALREQLLLPLTQQVDQLLLAYARENGFDLVLDASNPNAAVIFSDDLINVTEDVIRYLEAKSEPTDAAREEPSRP